MNGILGAITNSLLKAVGDAIEKKDGAAFSNGIPADDGGGVMRAIRRAKNRFCACKFPRGRGVTVINFSPPEAAPNGPGDPVARGKLFFQQNCALCHATATGSREHGDGRPGAEFAGRVRAARGFGGRAFITRRR